MGIFDKNKLSKIKTREKNSSKYNILLIDDEKANINSLSNVLNKDYNILCAFDGLHALDLIHNHESPESIQVIISDQRMPKLSGIEFFQKSLQVIPKTIRILLTGFTDVESIINSINEGKIYKYLTKPIEPNELLVTVQRALEHYELEEKLLQKNIFIQEEKKKLQNQAQEAILLQLNNDELKWTLNCIKGMMFCNNENSDNEIKYLHKILDYVPDKKDSNKFLKEFEMRKCEDMTMINMDKEKAIEILCILINITLSDGKVNKNELNFFTLACQYLGFEDEVAIKMFNWAKNMSNLQVEHKNLKQASRKILKY